MLLVCCCCCCVVAFSLFSSLFVSVLLRHSQLVEQKRPYCNTELSLWLRTLLAEVEKSRSGNRLLISTGLRNPGQQNSHRRRPLAATLRPWNRKKNIDQISFHIFESFWFRSWKNLFWKVCDTELKTNWLWAASNECLSLLYVSKALLPMSLFVYSSKCFHFFESRQKERDPCLLVYKFVESFEKGKIEWYRLGGGHPRNHENISDLFE